MKYLEQKIPFLIDWGIKIVIVLLVFFIGRKVIKALRGMVCRSLERAKMDEGAVHFLSALVNALMYVVLLGSLATYLGVAEGSIIALFSSAGVGVALALKESLSNLAGGLILLLTKPFILGDYIKEDGHGNEGTVRSIGLFYTELVTPDNRTVSIPNGMLSNSSLVNITRQDKRQLRETVGISYESDLKLAKEKLEYILENDEGVLKEEPIEVFVDSLGESAVLLGWRAWVKPDDYWTVKWRITEIVKYVFDETGIEIPYNKLDVFVRQ